MADFEVGDILTWDREHSEYHEVVNSGHHEYGPSVMTRPNGLYHCYVKRLNGLPFHEKSELSCLRYRFRKDEFLTAARKACKDA